MTADSPSSARSFVTGMGYLARGLAHWRYAPGTMAAGWVPAILVFAVFVAALVALGLNVGAWSIAVTPFADAWREPWRDLLRFGVAVAIFAVGVIVGIRIFTTITLIVGAWFYERIWMSVEARFGPVPDSGLGFWRGAGVGVADAVRMLPVGVATSLLVFAAGLVPGLGGPLAVVVGALTGGRLLTLDLTGSALSARGLSLRQRMALVRGGGALSSGFGVAVYLVFLIPGFTVLLMPAAVAGASLLARRLTEPQPPARV